MTRIDFCGTDGAVKSDRGGVGGADGVPLSPGRAFSRDFSVPVSPSAVVCGGSGFGRCDRDPRPHRRCRESVDSTALSGVDRWFRRFDNLSQFNLNGRGFLRLRLYRF